MNSWRNWERGWILLGAFLLLAAAYIWVDEAYVPDLSGRWISGGCETLESQSGGVSRLTRDYVIGDDAWHLDLTFFDDEDCAKKSFALGVDGRYDLGAKSLEVAGATQARFSMERLKLTAYTDEMASLFRGGKCGVGPWLIGVGQDVSRNGCLQGIPSALSCPAEYDLVRRRGDELWFGDRSRSLCLPNVYPTQLGDAPVLKQE